MRTLENRIPPPLVALSVAAGMWIAAPATNGAPRPVLIAFAVILALIGVGLAVAGSVSFRKAKTTVNPLRPENASALVATGVYRFTRNPMYLGMLLCLVAIGVYRSSVWAMAGPLIFLIYMNRFQIVPEEAVLEAKFGSSYLEYKSRVRRWL